MDADEFRRIEACLQRRQGFVIQVFRAIGMDAHVIALGLKSNDMFQPDADVFSPHFDPEFAVLSWMLAQSLFQ